MKRAGFSLVELVISIVVIAISVMAIPLMLQESSKNDSFTLTQEVILGAKTKMGNILTYQWDENSTDRETEGMIRVLDVQNGDSELDRNGSIALDRENKRIGHIVRNKRRKMMDEDNSFPSSVVDGLDDIDDFDGENTQIIVDSGESADGLDYIFKDVNISTSISYVLDQTDYSMQNIDFNLSTTAISVQSTNIKMIEVNVTSDSLGTPFVLRAFVSNIGETQLDERYKE